MSLKKHQEYSDKPKLTPSMLSEAQTIDPASVFGNWINNVEEMNTGFLSATPYPHIIIPDFLQTDLANEIEAQFPVDIDNRASWHRYNNPIEVKYANDHIEQYPATIYKLFLAYTHPVFIDRMRTLTGIADLEYDEFMHGAGLHIHPQGGRLGIHLDYEKHPLTGKQRRINIILYMSRDWQPEWNGQTELWNADVSACVARSPVVFNQAVIFRTDNISWHGLPEPITSPPGIFRKSIAYYYVAPFSSITSEYYEPRTKAQYVPRPGDPPHVGLAELYRIRPLRRIADADIEQHYPEWFTTDYSGL